MALIIERVDCAREAVNLRGGRLKPDYRLVVVDQGIGALEEIHAALRELAPRVPVLRTPLRNVRAGLRDIMDARPVFVDWEERPRALSGQATS